MERPLSQSDYEALAEFRYRLRKFLHFSEEAARRVGLTPNQHQLMLAIQGFPGRPYATPSELAERLQLKAHSCLGLIQRCEKAGYVERFANASDRRSIYVTLTPKGLSILEALTHSHRQQIIRLGIFQLVGVDLDRGFDES